MESALISTYTIERVYPKPSIQIRYSQDELGRSSVSDLKFWYSTGKYNVNECQSTSIFSTVKTHASPLAYLTLWKKGRDSSTFEEKI
jgi:hypothetical protein